MSSDSSFQPRVAIIGGGMGGLALLLTLHRRGVAAALYERDTGFNARAHLGGTLDLGWKSGQRALRENGLQGEFDKNSRPEGDEMRVYDGAGKLHLKHGGEGEDVGPPRGPEDLRPEIDRTVLRKLLLDAIPPHLIKWDHALSSVRAVGNGQHELIFADGSTTTCDFLVGADGGNSRVRALVSPETPAFLGVNGAEVSLAPETTKLPELAETIANVGKGGMFGMQDSRLLCAQVNGDGRIRTYVFLREAESWTIPADPAAAKATLKGYFSGWQRWLLNLIDYGDERAIYPRAMYTLPVGHAWAHVPGVTLVSDAAHLMSPFAGAGANLALLDGLELGLVLASLQEEGKLGDARGVAEAVAAFEDKMCAMAGRVADKANRNLAACVGPNTPEAALKRFAEGMSEGEREG
ncbi:monooxygenase [Ganoderma leucocontextum]|nr:monooxygenase [Ganoderma leucocontextum]